MARLSRNHKKWPTSKLTYPFGRTVAIRNESRPFLISQNRSSRSQSEFLSKAKPTVPKQIQFRTPHWGGAIELQSISLTKYPQLLPRFAAKMKILASNEMKTNPYDVALKIGEWLRLEERSTLLALICNISKYSAFFPSKDSPVVHTNVIQHNIDTGDARPVNEPPRRFPVAQKAEVEW